MESTSLLHRNYSDRISIRSNTSSSSSTGISSYRPHSNTEMVLNPTELLDQVLVECPNHANFCSQVMLPRGELPSHILQWCQSIIKRCPYHQYGCTFSGRRNQILAHRSHCSFRTTSQPHVSESTGIIITPSSLDYTTTVTNKHLTYPSSPSKSFPPCATSLSSSDFKNQAKGEITEGIVTVIEIDLNFQQCLGLRLVGGQETALQHIYIQSILPDSLADQDGRLNAGDQIIEINQCDLTQMDHACAMDALTGQIHNACSISLAILRENNTSSTKIISIKLNKKSNEILGLKMGSLTNRYGVYIHEIIKETEAERNGGFQKWDRVLQVNDIYILEYSQEKVTQIINSLNGTITIVVARTEPSNLNSSESDGKDVEQDLERYAMDSELYYNRNVIAKEKLISITKSAKQNLGLTIAGGLEFNQADTPIYIANISANSILLDKSKHTIHRGDILLSVNNVDLLGIRHDEAVSALKNECDKCEKIDIRILKSSQKSFKGNQGNFHPYWIYWFNLPSYYHFPKIVTLYKDKSSASIGFSIVGGIDTFQMPKQCVSPGKSPLQVISQNTISNSLHFHVMIKSILPGSPAEKCGQLKCGDILLSVDNTPVNNLPHKKIVQVLRSTTQKVKLKIIRWPGSEV